MNVRVIVRVRPLLPNDKKYASRRQKDAARGRAKQCADLYDCVAKSSLKTLDITTPHPKTGEETIREFAFDHIFDHKTSQRDFFESCGIQDLIRSTLDGFAAVVFAYGQTGSGKTFTMSGKEQQIDNGGFRSPETDGLIPRSLSYLYAQIHAAKKEEREYNVSSSYMEIYNEQVFDLLSNDGKSLPVRYQYGRGFFVEKQLVVECESFEDLCAVAIEGHNNRTVRSHSLNMHSSRSHAVFTVYVEGKNEHDSSVYGKITFIDLAGSENVKQSKSEGVALKETNNINKSLFALGKVISILAAKHQGKLAENVHVPFRDSVLTKLLMDSLGGNGLAMMIACCSPSSLHVDETLRTLQYATRAKNIRNKPVQNMSLRDHDTNQLKEAVKQLKLENQQLRQLLAQNGISPPPPRPIQVPMFDKSPMVSRQPMQLSTTTERPPNLVIQTSLSPEAQGERAGSAYSSFSALHTPIANFHDQTGMLVKSPKRGNVGSRENCVRESLDTSMGALDKKLYTRSQERLALRLEKRSSRRSKRTPRSDSDDNSSERNPSSALNSSREQQLAQENKKLKSRLTRLETIFVKGRDSAQSLEEAPSTRSIEDSPDLATSARRSPPIRQSSRQSSSFNYRAPIMEQAEANKLSVYQRIGTGTSVNVATPGALPSYTSVVSSPKDTPYRTPAFSRGMQKGMQKHEASEVSGEMMAHVPMSHPFFSEIATDN